MEFRVRLLRIQTERKPRRSNCFSCHPLHLCFPTVCNASCRRDFFFFPESFWVLSLSIRRGEKALLSSPTSWWFVEERLHLTGMDSGELRMFQNIGLYRSRVLGSLFPGTEETLPSENLFLKFLGNTQKGRAEMWTKGNFPFIHFLLIVRTQDRQALSSV